MKKTLAIFLFLGLVSSVAFGDNLGVNLPAAPSNDGASVWTLGYSFEANHASSVVALGDWYDGSSSDASYGSQKVGLWNSSGTLLASAFVSPSGTVTDSQWIFSSITPVQLTAGDTYYVGAQGGWDYTGANTQATFSPDLTFLFDQYANTDTSSSDLAFPNLSESDGPTEAGWFGGNVELAATPTPEPDTFLMMGSGLLALAGMARRKFARR
jgi:hypothetical protein